MASFSPAPRRSSRLRVGSSRLSTPLRPLEKFPDNVSLPSVMDVDESSSQHSSSFRSSGDTIFTKSEQLTVSFYAELPVEVSQILNNADFYRDPYTGSIDTLTGFTLVASVQTCFVWQHAQAAKAIPTCYIFACPIDPNRMSPPFYGLFPHGSSREPGLLLVSTSGEIRLWDSIGIGLAGGEQYTTAQLDLGSSEVTNLIRADPQTFILSTSSGFLFRLILASTAGKQYLIHHAFARPAPAMSFSRLLPSIFSSASSASLEPGNVNSVALGPKTLSGGREVWALVDTRLQKWDMKLEGWEDLLLDEDVVSVVRRALRSHLPGIDDDNSRLDLELVDLAVESEGDLFILISYAGSEDENPMAMDMRGVRRLYAIVYIVYAAGTFDVTHVRQVPYQCTSSSGAPMHPRIQIMEQGHLASIQFGDAVALVARDSHYNERMELRSSRDCTLGVGVVHSDLTILVLTAAIMMKASVDMDKLLTFDPANGRADLVKSTMTQAILYGSLPNNPLHFSFPPEIDEDSLMRGAEQLSQAILQSDPDLVRRNHDLSAQLGSRKERLGWLIRFINDNAVLEKMSQTSRQQIATDAEKLEACYQLWVQHNSLLATNPLHSILNDVVYAFMAEAEHGHHDDFMRAFFRLRVADIGELLRRVPEVTVNAAKETGRNIAELLPEANTVVLTVLKSAFQHREQNTRLYGIHFPMVDPWTSVPVVIDTILTLFETSARVVETTVPGSVGSYRTGKPYSQLPELAAQLFACVQERLDWLSSSSDILSREKHELDQRFASLRPQILETLRANGHEDAAFSLAEKYRDFSSLADLCHRETVYPPSKNPNAARIEAYVQRFKEDFTTELYRWYIQHGELRVMFSQDGSHEQFLSNFLSNSPYTSISWINDLGHGWYDSAAKVLLGEAEHASYLEAKHLMLSIGKLSHLAHLQSEPLADDSPLLDAFHDDLDFVSVHEALLQECHDVIQKLRGRQSLDTQVDAIVNAKASSLSNRPALATIFKGFIRQLLQGKVLAMEDMVDVLSLKDNVDTVDDYATALHLLARVQNIPQARKLKAFYSVWRRIYIHDDWDAIRETVNVSDAELIRRYRGTALYASLRSVLSRQEEQEGYVTVPNVALIIPTTAEIASRWPGMSGEQVDGVVQDYNFECDKLGELDLDDVYDRVKELATEDANWERTTTAY